MSSAKQTIGRATKKSAIIKKMWFDQWPSSNPIMMHLSFAKTQSEFYSEIGRIHGAPISSLSQLKLESPVLYQSVMRDTPKSVLSLSRPSDHFDPHAIWENPRNICRSGKLPFFIYERLKIFLALCKRLRVCRDMRWIVGNMLIQFETDYFIVFKILCGSNAKDVKQRTAPFVRVCDFSNVRNYGVMVKRIHAATLECIHRGFWDLDFYDFVERFALTDHFALAWFQWRRTGKRSKPYASKDAIGFLSLGSYFCELAHRHTQFFVDENIFDLKIFNDMSSIVEKNIDLCIRLAMVTLKCRYANNTHRMREEVRWNLRSTHPALQMFRDI